MATTNHTNASCPLLNLPPELRNTIYELALLSAQPIEIPSNGRLSAPPLIQVCRQTRSEATAIYYGQNAFRCIVVYEMCRTAYDWLTHLPRTTVPMIHNLQTLRLSGHKTHILLPGSFKQNWTLSFGEEGEE
ncbi:hypothetical protein EJ03DRAFT_374270 [Teratosphaeria nubilosa]|uniref:2EXR domain-containing protein n=1 Tax=Teratosphaeria nubilosa TaxID=161662 RepID=A0A6G1LA12_9PEZI|nr:hypothetical protein EJ03DRAFT_374270 [Teratosphaeria nubilosa]